MLPSRSIDRTACAGHSALGVAWGLLGLMAMAQLVVAGVALAVRFKESKEIKVVEREVIREIRVEVPVAGPATLPPLAGLPEVPSTPVLPILEPTPLVEPLVADPQAERLLNEGREARVAGDMGKAIVKLEQALRYSPENPNVIYELGMVHEQMGVFDKAAEYYEQVFRMGLTKAGSLYPLAAAKLRDGFAQPADMLGKLSLGRVRIFKNTKHQKGQQVILTIPVQKSPSQEVDVAGIEVEVRFFNRTSRGDIVELEDASWAKSSWVSLPFDWVGGEESLRMTYTIPSEDLATEHLFGERNYYGQVVTLTYEGEVLDVQAWPRDLAARAKRQPVSGFGELLAPEFEDSLPPDFDPAVPLLPALPE